jgi:hypothetical protein
MNKLTLSAKKPERQPFPTRSILLRGQAQVHILAGLIPNLPLDIERPIEVLIREQVKARGLDANALMWAGPLADIAAQAYVNGRTYSAEVWHEFFKREYLPEDTDHDILLLAKDGYHKWDYTPDGERVLIGSTTQLTKRGFSDYMMQIESYGASIGVQFHTNPRDHGYVA